MRSQAPWGNDGLEEERESVPDLPVPEMAGTQHFRRRQHFLREIDRMSHNKGSFASKMFSPRRITVALGAAVVAGAVILTLSPEPTLPAAVPPATAASAALLERAALAAAAEPVSAVRGNQYSYLKVAGHTTVLSENAAGGMDRRQEREDMEQWTSVDGSTPTFQRKNGKSTWVPETPGEGSFNAPTYTFATSLPSNPEALLKAINEEATKNHGQGTDSTTGPDQEAFVAIGDLLRSSVTPPDITAALYRAAARIPGVVTLPHAVDAAGRTGVAVAREHNGERAEWIFDTTTAHFLGSRTVLTKSNAWGDAGTAVTSIAVIGHGIADEAGQVPRTTGRSN
ncbi:CU044_5270 family protein [Streptomyces filamentosus]|uniref:CU044_5270 family protein n=1 Tax=Streptomyces filamentosus TaxID=67294 RepID=A0A919BHS2_STRFL|nr:CU044_5270 family protein [Streptomyces filamentosus]GHF91978.1 hypothetical protein GCM10017667_21820 [Streptomyces filamentosus]